MILDIVLIVVILLGVFIGYKKGFVKVVVKLGTFVLAIILAFLLKNSVANFIGENLGFNNTVSSAIQNKLVDFTSNGKGENNIPIFEDTINEISKVAEDKKEETISKWSDKITTFIINGMSFILIFVVVSILMGIIGLILDTVVKLPVLNTLNGALGAGIEFILMMLRIMIILAIVSFLSPLELLTGVTDYINQSCITKWLYENNIIISIIGRNLLK